MRPIVIDVGFYLNIKCRNIGMSVDRNRRFKIVIPNGFLFLAPVLHIRSAANIFSVFYHLGKDVQQRQLFRRQIGIADDLAGHIVVDVYRVGPALIGDAGYRHIFHRLKQRFIGILQRSLESPAILRAIEPAGTVHPPLRRLYAAAVHCDGGSAFLCLHRHLALIGVLDGGYPPGPDRSQGRLLPAAEDPGRQVHVSRVRRLFMDSIRPLWYHGI